MLRLRQLGTAKPSKECGPHRRCALFGAADAGWGLQNTCEGVVTWLEGWIASGARHERASIHPRNRTPPPNWGSAKVGVPGRPPSTGLRAAAVEPALACSRMLRPEGSPGFVFVQTRSAPPPAARMQGCGPPRRGALTMHWDRVHSIIMPAATRAAGAAPFPPADGRTRNESIGASLARTRSLKMA